MESLGLGDRPDVDGEGKDWEKELTLGCGGRRMGKVEGATAPGGDHMHPREEQKSFGADCVQPHPSAHFF